MKESHATKQLVTKMKDLFVAANPDATVVDAEDGRSFSYTNEDGRFVVAVRKLNKRSA